MRDKKLSQAVALGQIEQVIRRGHPSDPPAYTLVLGAGASFGSVPTAKQILGLPAGDGVIHPQAIPLYLYELENGAVPLPAERKGIVQAFWKKFSEANSDLLRPNAYGSVALALTAADGWPTPETIASAYQALFSQNRSEGINTAEGARNYLRTITLPKDSPIQLNGTHFFLASLLSLQTRHHEKGARSAPLYVGRRPFARTLFTTNFDPLLQVSLQLFQLLYYMTDRPELLAADALQTDDHPATHLFYAHGSVHRPFLANSDGEIGLLRERNGQNLASYLGRHGVIVLGYSGWDDCLLRALQQTSSFANNLYWLARSEASLSPEVRKFLCSRPNAYWVEIADGGQWMAALHQRLCPGMPFTELLKNPIPFLRRRLEQVALGSIVAEPPPAANTPDQPASATSQSDQPTPEALRLQVVGLLQQAEQQFEAQHNGDGSPLRIKTLEHQADLAYGNKEWNSAADLYTQIIEAPGVPTPSKSLGIFRRGVCHGQFGELAKEIADYSAVIALPGAPPEHVAKALYNRGITHGQLGDSAKEIADYSSVIALPGVTTEQVASALFNRGNRHGQLGDSAKEIADYSAVIALPGAPAEHVAKALFNRGITYAQLGDSAKGIADYSAVIALPGAPTEIVASALFNLGNRHGQLGDSAKEIADFSSVIALPGAPSEHVAKALFNRGFRHGKLGNFAEAIADYSTLITLPGATTEQVAKAFLHRGNTHGQLGDSAKEIADYSAVIALPGAPAETVTEAQQAIDKLQGLSVEPPTVTPAPRSPRNPRR